jgi:hypothetical protein
MISLRDEFTAEYTNHVNALECIKTGVIEAGTRFSFGMNDTNGDKILVNGDAYSQVINIIRNGVRHSFDPRDIIDKWNQPFELGGETEIGEVFSRASSNADTYQVLSQLATKYSYANRVKYNDLLLYTDGLVGDDVRTIKESLFNATNDEGYVSLHSFLSILQSWKKDVDEAADDESFEIDTTNPFRLECLMNTVISGVYEVASIILTAVKGIWAVIAALILGVINVIMRMVNYVGDLSDVKLDYECNNQFVSGPIIATENITPGNTTIPRDGHIYYSSNGGASTFTWWNSDKTKIKMNSYLEPYLKPYQTINWLVDNGYLSYTKENNISWLYIPESYTNWKYGWSHIYDSIPDWCKHSASDPAVTPGEVIGSIGTNLVVYSIYLAACNNISITGRYQFGIKYVSSSTPGTVHPTASSDEKVFFYAIRHLLMAMDEASYDDFIAHQDMDMEQLADNLTSWLSNDILPKRDSLLQRATSPTALGVVYNYSGSAIDDYVSWNMVLPYTLAGLNQDAVFIDNNGIYQIYTALETMTADCLPVKTGVTLPAFNSDSLKQVFAIIAIATTVATISVTALSVSMAKRRRGKQALRAANINKLREEYLADPTDQAKREAFESASLKFDVFGRVFGWGSYDAANGWFNAPSKSTQSENSFLSSILSRDVSTDTVELVKRVLKLIDKNQNV